MLMGSHQSSPSFLQYPRNHKHQQNRNFDIENDMSPSKLLEGEVPKRKRQVWIKALYAKTYWPQPQINMILEVQLTSWVMNKRQSH